VSLHEHHDEPRRHLQERLVAVGAERRQRVQPLPWRSLGVELPLFFLGGLANPLAQVRSAFDTATKCQGCRLAPLGAVPAVRIASSTIERGTGSGE
jgi:hypothetical protein